MLMDDDGELLSSDTLLLSCLFPVAIMKLESYATISYMHQTARPAAALHLKQSYTVALWCHAHPPPHSQSLPVNDACKAKQIL